MSKAVSASLKHGARSSLCPCAATTTCTCTILSLRKLLRCVCVWLLTSFSIFPILCPFAVDRAQVEHHGLGQMAPPQIPGRRPRVSLWRMYRRPSPPLSGWTDIFWRLLFFVLMFDYQSHILRVRTHHKATHVLGWGKKIAVLLEDKVASFCGFYVYFMSLFVRSCVCTCERNCEWK